MKSLSLSGDLLLAFIGSALFWLTLSGIAIRALRLDFHKLEQFLKDSFTKIDGLTFHPKNASEVAVTRTLRAIYGKQHSKMIAVTAVVACVLNIYVIALFHSDWLHRRHEISALEDEVISRISPDYFRLSRSDDGKKKIMHAFEEACVGQGGCYFVNHGKEDVGIRALYEKFYDSLQNDKESHHRSYDLALARYFGDGFLNAYWLGKQRLQLFSAVLMMIIIAVFVDSAAVYFSFDLAASFFKSDTRGTFMNLLGLVACFACSLINYVELFAGEELGLLGLILWGFFWTFGLFVIKDVLETVSIRVIIFIAIVASALLIVAPNSWLRVAFFPLYNLWYSVVAQGINSKAILVSMVTLFPIISIASIAFTVHMMWLLWTVGKAVFLGQVYGASVLSGSTYFLGFLTTIISCTAFTLFLMRILSR